MCVIVVKKRGVKFPNKSVLMACAKANKDGFGFVSETMSYKTLDFEDFYKHLRAVPVSENCIMHFRWATHGSVKVENCHPFCHRGVFFAHNGVLNVRTHGDMTDSETVFKRYISPIIAKYGVKSEEMDDYMDFIGGGSRFAIMTKGEISLFGHFSQIDGVMYSNLNWYSRLTTNSICNKPIYTFNI